MSNPEIDQSILDLWATHQTLRKAVHGSQAELKQVRRNLGLLLVEKQKELAVIGPAGTFTAWLRSNRIATMTAYRMIAQVTGQPPKKNLLPEKINVPVRGQDWELLGDILVVRMAPKGREMFRAAIAIWEAANPQFDLQNAILMQLALVIPAQLRGPVATIGHRPDSEFAPASYPAVGWPNRTPPPPPPDDASSVPSRAESY